MKKHASGFTLIEIIVALFIFAIIAVIISYGLHNVFNAKQKITFYEKRLSNLQLTTLLLRHDLSQLIDIETIAISNSTLGSNKQLTFITTNNANPLALEKRSNLMYVRYDLNKGQLVRTVWFNAGTEQSSKPFERILLKHIEQLKFRYLTRSGFIDTWPPTNEISNTPPLAVQVSFDIPGWGNFTQLYRVRGTTIDLH